MGERKPAAKKRGKLSIDETNYIESNVHELSVAEIAKKLNRTEAPVVKYIKAKKLLATSNSFAIDDEERLLNILSSRPYWRETTKQITESEQEFYKQSWIHMMAQFQEDVLYTEEININEWCKIMILQNRSMVEQKEFQEEIERLTAMMFAEKCKDLDERDEHLVLNFEAQLSAAKAAVTSYGREGKDLRADANKIQSALKATRADRNVRIEDGKQSWPAYLRMLEDEDVRAAESRRAELLRMSSDKIRLELGKHHQYEDDEFGRPFLTPEVVDYYEENPDEDVVNEVTKRKLDKETKKK
jgi:hypothetical protein